MHNDSPIDGLDVQILNSVAGSPDDRTFQAAVLLRQRETQFWMSEYGAEPFRQPIRRSGLS